ncbi:MAG: tol-pal system protein YbgF [Rhodobacteraceae bacterium]|nr:tol-pal system protein YbgF [Paracoccaceae bacterium]
MAMMRILLVLALVLGGTSATAQTRRETLADIRQELSFLYVEIQRLKQEQSTTGDGVTVSGSGTPLKRLDAVEGELQRITGKVEELEFRIDRIVRDGTRRIGDLEFRLVELEGGDISKLGETTTLGGEPLKTPPAVVVPDSSGSEMAVSEQSDYAAARKAFDDGDHAQAAEMFAAFAEAYPGGPLTPEAQYYRGESLAALSNWSSAARSFLQAFSSAPDSDIAPQSLYRLGISLDKIGQRQEACLTLNEVGLRYPGSAASDSATADMAAMDCGI